MNDIYSFFRMFRTFDESKRKYSEKSCLTGEQSNIIYISHLGHAMGIVFLIKQLFGFQPKYADSINNKMFKPILKVYLSDDPNPFIGRTLQPSWFCNNDRTVKECNRGLGDESTPNFFAEEESTSNATGVLGFSNST